MCDAGLHVSGKGRRTFTTEYSHPVAPRTIAEIDGAASVIRDTGEFKVTTGNRTWLLHDMYFDTPPASQI